MWRTIKVLCCPNHPEYTHENSNLGYLDQCDTCDNKFKCRKTIEFYELIHNIIKEKEIEIEEKEDE